MRKKKTWPHIEKMGLAWGKWAHHGGKWVQKGENGYRIGRIGSHGRSKLNTGKIGLAWGKRVHRGKSELWFISYIEVLGLVCFSFKFRAKLNRIHRVPIGCRPHV